MKKTIPNEVAIGFFTEHIEGASKSASVFRGRCPACGDSTRSKAKKRLYLLNNTERGWHVYCHNCELSQSLYNFVRDYYPGDFPHFKSRCLSEYVRIKKQPKEEVSRESRLLNKLKKKEKVEVNKEDLTEVEKFYQNECIPLPPKIKEEMKQRNLSPKIVRTLRLCRTDKRRYKNYADRIVIPFFDENNRVFYFQARATDNEQSPKYINWDQLDSKPEYNEFGVNRNEPVYIVEGLFDSTFINNAVSTLGVKVSHSKILYLSDKYKKGIYCMDNDKDGMKWTKLLLKMNKTCLVFPPKYKDFKDLNDIAVHEGVNDLTEFVRENSHKGLKGLLQLNKLIRS